MLEQTTYKGTIAMLLNAGPVMNALAEIAFADNRLVIGSSANVSLQGVKFRAEGHRARSPGTPPTSLSDYGLDALERLRPVFHDDRCQ